MHLLRKSALALTSGVVALGVVVVAPAAVAEQAAVPAINWQPCGEQNPGFDCATVDVPLDYDQPRGPKTQLSLARKPAADKKNRIGTVFINPGGPGGSGVDMAFGFGNTLAANLNGRFDVVGFDPRGIGRSSPLRCFQTFEEASAFFSDPAISGTPYETRQQRPYVEKFRSLGPKCQANAGAIARHMSTADVVRDMDLLRRAVGDKKLTYLGFSYGTFIGNTYASMFPGNIRALVIDGVLDPQLWSSGWQIADDRTNSGKVIDEMFRLCDEAGPSCVFHKPGQTAKARWEALADAVRAKPVEIAPGQVVTYDNLISSAINTTYSPTSWRGFMQLLVAVANASAGAPMAVAPAKQEEYPNFFEAYYGNICADTEYPRSTEAYQAIGRYAEAGSRFGPAWWWSNAACADWPVNQDRFTGPWKTRTSAPVLIVGNYFDGVTSYEGAQASARNIKGSRLLSYAGWGHAAYNRNTCVAGYVNSYLLTGALPAEGTVCAANPNPFQAAGALAESPQLTWPMR
jgi:pimeloyl-ACP methyl ester carboxylesterase